MLSRFQKLMDCTIANYENVTNYFQVESNEKLYEIRSIFLFKRQQKTIRQKSSFPSNFIKFD